jgi:hypothetical protein
MPISPAQTVAVLVPSLASVAMVGMGVPKFSMGLGIGLSTWTPTIAIQTVDAGTLGVGKGIPVPILLISSVLQANLHIGFASQGLLGVLEPAFVLGLTNGLVQLYAQSLTNTVHPGVGLGAGVATFNPSPAVGHIIAGFSALGMSGEGPTKIAMALAMALENTFRMLILPQPIVGPPNIVPGAGVGTGNII